MGNCNNSGQNKVEKSSESVDPPVAAVVEDPVPVAAKEPEPPHPAPITVDLYDPPVDPSAPLDDRDIDLVQQTFARVAMLGAENVGWVLFMNIFEIAPPAKDLFPFKDEKNIANSSRMKAHAGRVVSTVATAVSLLRDLDTLVPVLHGLGLKHVGYGVLPEHYHIVGTALIQSLNTALGDKMTPAVTNAYLKVFTIVKETMIEKCDYTNLTPEVAPVAAQPEPVVAQPDGEAAEAGGTETKHGAETRAKDKKLTNQPSAAAKKKKADDAPKKRVEEEQKPEEEGEKKPEEQAKADGPTIDEQLLAAAAKGDDKTVAKLLKNGALVNATDADGKTALMFASEQGLEDMVGRLTAIKKIKPNLKTVASKGGDTALHLACANDHKDCAVMLVRCGADVKIKNKNGKLARDLTNENQLKEWLMRDNPGGTPPPWQGQKMR